ncbi:MAG: DNA polymerase III subunit gamma/tau [Deltaproteobacteria bacterium]|nr:DNA polymerase III subunit gamma/tau [Deltaproteobacteria bacterium]
MSYTVLARKYRPQSFEALVGQEHVARTLGNAIAQDRVAHAFLFTGVRGVGKTSAARLLAKALNCEQGPTATPCNECAICREITAGVDTDVQEVDGASNNSVDDVRRLQESLPYRPTRDRFKVVIVDEVHMLSTGAFNAFLKTLEEPPSHVKFIFATTESHKVPITIRSRCQRYDFRLIPERVIAKRVSEILELEKITSDAQAISIVAREAAGSMRDALTLLDQLVALGGERLEGAEVTQALGIAARGAVHDAARAVLLGDGKSTLEAVAALAEQGVDMLHFSRQLLELLRDYVVIDVAGADTSLVSLVEEERARALELTEQVETLELERAFAAVGRIVDEVARASSPRTSLEMGLLRVATRPHLLPLAELLERLDALEKRLGSAPHPPAGGGRDRHPKAAPKDRGPRDDGPRDDGPRGGGAKAPRAKAMTAAESVAEMARQAQAESGSDGPHRAMGDAPSSTTTDDASAPAEATSAPVTTPDDAQTSAPVTTPDDAKTNAVALTRRPALQEWERMLRELRGDNALLAAVLEHAVPRVVTAERIVIAYDDGGKGEFYRAQATSSEATTALVNLAERMLGGRPEIEVRLEAGAKHAKTTVAAVTEHRRVAESESRRRAALSHPKVLEALEVFPEAAGSLDVRLKRPA